MIGPAIVVVPVAAAGVALWFSELCWPALTTAYALLKGHKWTPNDDDAPVG